MRSRIPIAVLTLCLLLAGQTHADDRALPSFHPDDLELLPLPEPRLEAFYRANEPLIDELSEIEAAREELEERMDEQPGNAWHKAEGAGLTARSDKAVAKLIAALAKEGVDRAAVERAATFPVCSSRVDRFAIAQTGAVRGVDPSDRKVLERAAVAADAALQTIDVARMRAMEMNEHKPVGDGVGRAFDRALLDRRDQVITRYWRLVDYVMGSASKRLLRARMPVEYHTLEDWVEHAMMLPGLTVGQAARLRAIDAASESEGAADRAAEERLSVKLYDDESDDSVSDEEREKLEGELDQVWRRLTALDVATLKQVRATLGEGLWGELIGIPARVYAELRLVGPEEALADVEFTSAQVAKLGPLVAKFRKLEEKLEAEYGKLEESLADLGPDSPQMGMMEMKEQTITGKIGGEIRALMRDVFINVMTTDQVVRWVLAPGPEDD